MINRNRCAVFDFDGTLRGAHVTQFFKDELHKKSSF